MLPREQYPGIQSVKNLCLHGHVVAFFLIVFYEVFTDLIIRRGSVVRFVDNSGTWGSGGMFSAVSRLSSNVPEAYEAAHEAGDLHLSDLHLIPVSGARLCPAKIRKTF